MAPASKGASEADIVFNRVNVQLANLKNTLASFLPPPTETSNSTAKAVDKDDEDLWQPVPDEYGIGADPPKDMVRKGTSSSLDVTRKRILGKRTGLASKRESSGVSNLRKDTHRQPIAGAPKTANSDDEEEAGRAAAVVSSRKRPDPHSSKRVQEIGDRERSWEGKPLRSRPAEESPQQPSIEPTRAGRKRPQSFLDEVLAEKATKRKRKKHKSKSQETSR